MACGGGGGEPEAPGERITDPARVHTSTPVQNPTLYKIQGNEVTLSGGATGQLTPVGGPTVATSTNYQVKSGDFCSTIAADHDISLEALLAANRNVDCNNLRIDDIIRIPAAATPTRTGGIVGNPTAPIGSNSGKTYTVQAGDTCDAIARNQGVGLAAFLALNGIDENCQGLREGQVVKIP